MHCMFLLSFIASFILTGIVRRCLLSKNIMDVPNNRSSHMMPTPRAGGLGFVMVFYGTMYVALSMGLVPSELVYVLVSSSILIALIGFLDDVVDVPAKWRFLVHCAASGIALYGLGGTSLHLISIQMIGIDLLINLLIIVYMTWLINLYNFMDGINGLAAIEAISVCLCASFLYWLIDMPSLITVLLALAGATFGFLPWNFPRARIFMGDVGSGFLGLLMAIFSIQGFMMKPVLFYSWLILLGIFLVDATFTLLRRLIRGDRIWAAHCTHAYQRAALKYHSHAFVTVSGLLINIVWLFPWSLLVAMEHVQGITGLIIAYLPLIALAYGLNAGDSQIKKQSIIF